MPKKTTIWSLLLQALERLVTAWDSNLCTLHSQTLRQTLAVTTKPSGKNVPGWPVVSGRNFLGKRFYEIRLRNQELSFLKKTKKIKIIIMFHLVVYPTTKI